MGKGQRAHLPLFLKARLFRISYEFRIMLGMLGMRGRFLALSARSQ